MKRWMTLTEMACRRPFCEDKGVYSAEFCPLRYHLLLIQYDRTKLNSRDILSKVEARNLSAQIVGPI